MFGTFFCFFQCFFGHLKKLLLKNEEKLINYGGSGKVWPRYIWLAKFLSGEKLNIFLFFIYPWMKWLFLCRQFSISEEVFWFIHRFSKCHNLSPPPAFLLLLYPNFKSPLAGDDYQHHTVWSLTVTVTGKACMRVFLWLYDQMKPFILNCSWRMKITVNHNHIRVSMQRH